MVGFERLVAWQEARKLHQMVVRITAGPGFKGRGPLVNQMRRSVESVPSNIAEGYHRNSWADRARIWNIATASLAELTSQLYAALDTGCQSSEAFRAAYDQADPVNRIAHALYRSHRDLASTRGI